MLWLFSYKCNQLLRNAALTHERVDSVKKNKIKWKLILQQHKFHCSTLLFNLRRKRDHHISNINS